MCELDTLKGHEWVSALSAVVQAIGAIVAAGIAVWALYISRNQLKAAKQQNEIAVLNKDAATLQANAALMQVELTKQMKEIGEGQLYLQQKSDAAENALEARLTKERRLNGAFALMRDWCRLVESWPMTFLQSYLSSSIDIDTMDRLNKREPISIQGMYATNLKAFLATVIREPRFQEFEVDAKSGQIPLSGIQSLEVRRVVYIYLNFFEIMAAACASETADEKMMIEQFGPMLRDAKYVEYAISLSRDSFPQLPMFIRKCREAIHVKVSN